MNQTLRLLVLSCALTAACSREAPGSESADGATAPAEPQSVREPIRPSPAGLNPPITETAQQYMERTRSRGQLEAGEAAPAAVGAIVQCAVCHGPNGEGNETLDAPRIGGLPAWYLARQLKYFKGGLRASSDEDVYGTQMRAISLPLHNRAIEDLAAYISQLNPPPAPAQQGGNVARGKQLYTVCAACHGMNAKGDPALNTPSLVEQSGSYLVRQLEHFRTGLRGSHPADVFGQQMKPIVQATLQSRQDAVDVATYIGTLRGDSAQQVPSASRD